MTKSGGACILLTPRTERRALARRRKKNGRHQRDGWSDRPTSRTLRLIGARHEFHDRASGAPATREQATAISAASAAFASSSATLAASVRPSVARSTAVRRYGVIALPRTPWRFASSSAVSSARSIDAL